MRKIKHRNELSSCDPTSASYNRSHNYEEKCCSSYIAASNANEQPFSFKPFNEFVIWYPEGCCFLIKTSIGEIELDSQCFDGVFCSGKFECDITSMEIILVDKTRCHSNNECLSALKVLVKHS